MDAVKAQHNTTASILYQVISSLQENTNVLISPFSINNALSMVWAGACGETNAQMSKALALPEDKQQFHEAYCKLLTTLKNVEEVDLCFANRFYIQNAYEILQDYSSLLKEKYLSELKNVDFGDATETSQLINEEVALVTRGKIKDLIDPSALNGLVRAIIVNAIYFKGTWQHPFDTDGTQKREFFVNGDSSVKTDMMFLDDKKFLGGELSDLECKVLEMPYKGGRFSMLLLLPDKVDGLKEVETKLRDIPLESIRRRLRRRSSMVIMPKFRVETSYELVNHLKSMGIIDLFDAARADLSNISGSKDLFVSKVVHKAFVEVTETGTEAAAATGLMMNTMCLPMDQLEFVADHPFHFDIIDTQTELVLFSGRFMKPE